MPDRTALEQAAAYLLDTGASVRGYLDMLEQEGLGAGDDLATERTVTAVFAAAIGRAAEIDVRAASLMDVIGYLGPELLPHFLFSEPDNRASLGIESASKMNAAIAALVRLGLVESSPAGLRVHRLVQEVARSRAADPADALSRATEALFVAKPDDITPDQWPMIEQLLPHILVVLDAAEGDASAGPRVADLQLWTSTYLSARGSFGSALDHGHRAVDHAERILGPDDPDTLHTRHNLAIIYADVGRHDDALTLTETVLTDYERILGPDHPNTLHTRDLLARLRSE